MYFGEYNYQDTGWTNKDCNITVRFPARTEIFRLIVKAGEQFPIRWYQQPSLDAAKN